MTELPPFNNPPPRPPVAPTGETAPGPGPSLAEPAAPPPEVDRWQGIQSLLAWVLRWALLVAGVGGAWLFGILVAQFFPSSDPEPPLQEVVTRRTSRFFQKVGSLPEWWAGDSLQSNSGAAPYAPAEPPPAPPPSAQPIALSEVQQEQVAVELEAIEEEMQRLRDRASAVEQQLGLPTVEMPLEERLDSASDRLSPPTEAAPAAPEPAAPALQPATGAAPDPLLQVNAYRVTLPSDVLFSPGQSTLQTNAQPLLDNILQDIGRYPNATIVVGSYTDIDTDQSTPTELSFQQAIAVQRYLAQRLGDDAVHWVTAGYGDSTIGSTGGVQLSRRVTIAIVP